MVGLPAPFVPHSTSLGPTTATRVLSAPVPISIPPTGLDVCFFFIYLVSDFLAVRFSVSSGCARRRSVSTYAAVLVLRIHVNFRLIFAGTVCLSIIFGFCPAFKRQGMGLIHLSSSTKQNGQCWGVYEIGLHNTLSSSKLWVLAVFFLYQ